MCAGVVAVERREDEGRWGGIAGKRVLEWGAVDVVARFGHPKFHSWRLCVSDVIVPFRRAISYSFPPRTHQATLIALMSL